MSSPKRARWWAGSARHATAASGRLAPPRVPVLGRTEFSAAHRGDRVRRMCNAYEQRVKWQEYRQAMEAAELGIPTQQGESDLLPQADDIRINDKGPVMRAAGNVIELVA